MSTMLHAEAARAAGKILVVFDRCHHAAGRLQHLVAARLPRVRHGAQHPLKARPAVAVVAGKIRSPKERLALRSQHRGQGPSVLPADRGHRRLVARIHIRTLVAVHLNRDEVVVDHLGQAGDPHNFPDPSHGTSGTTRRRYRAGWACLPLRRGQRLRLPIHATAPAGAWRTASTRRKLRQGSWSGVSSAAKSTYCAGWRPPSHSIQYTLQSTERSRRCASTTYTHTTTRAKVTTKKLGAVKKKAQIARG